MASKKILTIDDSGVIRKIIRRDLAGHGYEIIEMEDGLQALSWLETHPCPDLITLDVEMPNLNGFDTYAKLLEEPYRTKLKQKDSDGVPVIFITGNDTIKDRQTAFALGASDFITKPFEKGDILSAVNKILNPDKRLRGLTALVVDDSNTARQIVKRSLKQEGLNVIDCEDGIQALEIICKNMAEIDIVITDLMMPSMDGDELCRKIREELDLHNLPVIVLTATPDHARLLDVFKAGATDYLVKPFVAEELLARITVHLDRTQLTKRLGQTVQELRDLNEMKDNLLAVCSHDLRSPLNGILGFCNLLLEKDYLKDEDKEGLAQIKSSGDYLLNLINDILDLSKFQSSDAKLEVGPLSLAELIQNSIQAMKNLAHGKNQKIKMIDKSQNSIIQANATAMMRVINNLLSNAIKFTPEKGKINFIIETTSPTHIMITIQDTGIGIAEDKMPQLFDKFTSLSQTGTAGEESTGLGLSIIKEIIEKHNGTITASSKPGKGSCFKIVLPLPESGSEKFKNGKIESELSQTVHKEPKPATVKQCKILLAEDNPVNIKLARIILTREGHQVSVARNGVEAVAAAKKADFDIIFMDMEMPKMNGLAATRKIRKAGITDTPIVALTSNTGQGAVDACMSAGMNDFLTKPFTPDSLKEKIIIFSSFTDK